MLVSDGEFAKFTPPGGVPIHLNQPTIETVRDAGLAWKARGDLNSEDMLVFFFSGHGMAAGARSILLARDYGRVNGRPLIGAINFGDMLEGMKSCKATRQVYFIDACRMNSDVLLRNASESGDVVIPTSYPLSKGWRQSVYYASLGGKAAYGQEKDLSLFTRALIKSLKGPGASDAEGDWRINTSRLQEALAHFASELGDPIYGPVQTPQSGSQTTFDFHFFNGEPSVPVYVEPDWYRGASPPDDMHRISISDSGNEVVDWSHPWQDYPQCCWAPNRFECWLEPGRPYTVQCHINGFPKPPERTKHVTPPFKLIRIARNG
jgi:Caspase domain